MCFFSRVVKCVAAFFRQRLAVELAVAGTEIRKLNRYCLAPDDCAIIYNPLDQSRVITLSNEKREHLSTEALRRILGLSLDGAEKNDTWLAYIRLRYPGSK